MGSVESSYRQNKERSPEVDVAANIRLTPDVLERWSMLAAVASASDSSPAPKTYHYQRKIGYDNDDKQVERPGGGGAGDSVSSTIVEQGGDGDCFSNAAAAPLNELQFEDVVNSSKESLRSLTNELMNDKVILGVAKDGRPTFETVGAWEVRQEKEEELRKNDQMWNEKLDALKEKYVDSMIEDAEMFFNRVDKLKCKQETFLPKNSCEILQSKIAKCYSSNPKEVVKCRPLVMKFYSCVEQLAAGYEKQQPSREAQ